MPDTRFERHWFGALIITLYGVLPMSALLYLNFFVLNVDDPVGLMSAGFALLIGVITALCIYLYYLSHVEVSSSGIKVVNYLSLFSSKKPETDWNTVTGMDVQQGVLAGLFGYGTLVVETAGDDADLTITYVDNVDAVREFIDQNASYGGSPSA